MATWPEGQWGSSERVIAEGLVDQCLDRVQLPLGGPQGQVLDLWKRRLGGDLPEEGPRVLPYLVEAGRRAAHRHVELASVELDDRGITQGLESARVPEPHIQGGLAEPIVALESQRGRRRLVDRGLSGGPELYLVLVAAPPR